MIYDCYFTGANASSPSNAAQVRPGIGIQPAPVQPLPPGSDMSLATHPTRHTPVSVSLFFHPLITSVPGVLWIIGVRFLTKKSIPHNSCPKIIASKYIRLYYVISPLNYVIKLQKLSLCPIQSIVVNIFPLCLTLRILLTSCKNKVINSIMTPSLIGHNCNELVHCQ